MNSASGQRFSFPARQAAQTPQAPPSQATPTRSPTDHRSTSAPTATHRENYRIAAERFAAWLQRQIETYRLPTRIAGAKGFDHLKPVFRDRADLPSSANLSYSLQESIAQS